MLKYEGLSAPAVAFLRGLSQKQLNAGINTLRRLWPAIEDGSIGVVERLPAEQLPAYFKAMANLLPAVEAASSSEALRGAKAVGDHVLQQLKEKGDVAEELRAAKAELAAAVAQARLQAAAEYEARLAKAGEEARELRVEKDKLLAETHRLSTPGARGKVGEQAVEDAIAECRGLYVRSTRNLGQEKYLDLLVAGREEDLAAPTEGAFRCAVEIKQHEGTVSTAAVARFRASALEAFEAGKYTAAVFISNAAPISNQKAKLVLEWHKDGRGNAFPLSYLHSPRTDPLTSEEIRLHLCHHLESHSRLSREAGPVSPSQAAAAERCFEGWVDSFVLMNEQCNTLLRAAADHSARVSSTVAEMREAALRTYLRNRDMASEASLAERAFQRGPMRNYHLVERHTSEDGVVSWNMVTKEVAGSLKRLFGDRCTSINNIAKERKK